MMEKTRIIILGGGFAGVYCANRLESYARHAPTDVVLISRHAYILFYPLLVEAGTGSAEARHCAAAIRSFFKKTRFRMGEIQVIDTKAQVVTFRRGLEGDVEHLPYDHLVLSLGSVTSIPPVPGLAETALQMKS